MTTTIRSSFLLGALLLTPFAARAQIAVVGSTVEERVAAAGESYVGTVVVRNLTQQDQPVRIYQTDYMFFADGTSHFNDPGTTARSNASWITPTVRSLLVPPQSEMTVTYTVKVPASDSLKGTYWSAIMVEGAPNEANRSSGGRPQVGVGSVMRYAVQVATHIQASGSRKVTFANSKFLTNPDSTQSFELDVLNAGDRGYRPALWIEVYDAEGALKANARQERGLLYPGTSLRQAFALGRLAPGTYRAIVFADSGEDAVFASQFTIRF
ncbi:MAG TPA: hypothetical protein VFO66_01075 [Gemmatimonadaceae bacterium]|nr:hypothetical protein [Gemmatimonadaceae bacterium]